jgi:hypothetical protein
MDARCGLITAEQNSPICAALDHAHRLTTGRAGRRLRAGIPMSPAAHPLIVRPGEAWPPVSEIRPPSPIDDAAQATGTPLEGGTVRGRQRCEAESWPKSLCQPCWRRRSACSPRAAVRQPISLERAANRRQRPRPARQQRPCPARQQDRHRVVQTQASPTPLRLPRRGRAPRPITPQRSRARRQERSRHRHPVRGWCALVP